MTKFLSALSLICVYWGLQHQLGTSLLSTENTAKRVGVVADFSDFDLGGHPRSGIARFSDTSISTSTHLSATNLTRDFAISPPFIDSAAGQAADSIAVSQDTVRFSNIGETFRLAVMVFDTTGTIISDAPLVWTIANPAIATVDQDGLVVAVSEGSTRIAITAGAVSAKVTVHVDSGRIPVLESERAALARFYEVAGGQNWHQNTNWFSEHSLATWYGVSTNDQGHVTALMLSDNNLVGQIPLELGNFPELAHLSLFDNDLSGDIPPTLGDLNNLIELYVNANRLSGPLPSDLGKLSNLHTLSIADNAGLSGKIPASFVNLEELRVFYADGTNVCLPANPLLQSWNNELATSSVSLCDVPIETQLDLSVSSLPVTEGNSNHYTVRLSSQPTGTVTVVVSGHTGTNLSLDKENLAFTTTNWNTAQTVTVTAGQDPNAANENVTLIHTASGGNYGDVSANVEIHVTDDDLVQLNLSVSSLPVTEGSNNHYTVRLSSQPTGTVTVVVSGHTGTNLSLDKEKLTFTTTNWNTAQTVTVTAGQDPNAINENVTLTHTASGGNYGNVSANVEIRVTDDDLVQLNLSVSSLPVTEGSNNHYTVRLSSQPTGTVTVVVSGHTGTNLSLDKEKLTFTTTNWNTAQTVTVTAGQDPNAINENVTLIHTASGGNYGNVSESLAVDVIDDDPAGVLVVSPASVPIDEGNNNHCTVRLSSQPTGTVTVTITGHANTNLTLDETSLTFTTSDWDTDQTVTITADQDVDATNDTATIVLTASGADYNSVSANVVVTVTDDDAPGVLTFSPETVSTPEGGSSDYTVRLSSMPTATVTVEITGHESTDLSLNKSSLTFTASDWSDVQTVTITADQDHDATNDTATLLHTASRANYGGVSGNLAVTVNDDDTQGLEISTPNLAVDEGNNKSYNVQLSSQPTGTVTVTITGHANTDLTLDETSLMFTTSNWNTDQAVTITTGQDDDKTNDTATLVHTASGADYSSVSANMVVTVTDDDVPGVLTFSPETVSTPEGGSSDYTVRLSSMPTATVTVEITGHESTDLSLNKLSLTFTTSDWNDAQTVTITADQDNDATNDTATLLHTASGANYGGVSGNLAVTVNDDDTQGLEISTPNLAVDEGNNKSYNVRLSSQPTGTVTVTITGHANTDLTLDETSLMFTTSNWNTDQAVTVTAGQDDDETNDTATLMHTASGADYSSVSADVVVTVTDDDAPVELVFSSETALVPEGGSSDYTVRLSSVPTATVTVTITGHESTDLSLNKSSLTFTASDWNDAQTVTITADQDHDATNDTATLLHTASGANYGGVSGNLAVTVNDDDTQGLEISTPNLAVDEGNNKSYNVRLSSQPTGTVTVTITGHANTDLTLDDTSLMFTTSNWNTNQAVTVTAGQDVDETNDTATLVHTASGADYEGVTGNLEVTVNDDDAPPVSDNFDLDLSASILTVEEGRSTSYTINLATKPSSDVTVRILGHARSDLSLDRTSLKFTPGNWADAQTVKVTAAHDIDWTSDHVLISHGASSNYGNVIRQIRITVTDDETHPAPPYAYVFQSVHSYFNSVPLIAGEPAYLRIFPIANAFSSTTLPRAIATFYVDDAVEHTINIPAKSSSIPIEVWPQVLRLSLNADIPATVVQPGLEMVIQVDPDDTVPNDLGIAKRIPATGRISLDVVTVPTFPIVIVPLVTIGHTGGESVVQTAQQMAANPNSHSLLSDVRTLLPIKNISATVHETVQLTSRTPTVLLTAVLGSRLVAGGSGYWIGLHRDIDQLGGVANRPGFASVSEPRSSTIAHELGHNLSLGHAPCDPDNAEIVGLDASYPYAEASIGSWGYRSSAFLNPSGYKDFMSYCYPIWVSDYHFKKAADHLSSASSSTTGAPPLASKSSETTLLLWGGTDAASRPHLKPIFVMETAPSLPQAPGPWRLVGYAGSGDELFHLTFDMPIIDDGDGSSSFAFAVPLQQEQSQLLDAVILSGPGGSFTIDKEHDDPMAIVIDQDSGQVTAFLDNYDPLGDSRLSVIGNNKSGGNDQRVLFSRGLPDLNVQN